MITHEIDKVCFKRQYFAYQLWWATPGSTEPIFLQCYAHFQKQRRSLALDIIIWYSEFVLEKILRELWQK